MPDVPRAAIEQVRRLCAAAPGLAAVLGALLDRREARGVLPGSATLAAGPAERRALTELLSARAVRAYGDRVRIDVSRADATCRAQLHVGLDDLLYASLERRPRDPAAEAAALVDALARGATELRGRVATDVARRFVDAELAAFAGATGDIHALARERGSAAAVAELDRLARCLDAAVANDAPIRIANFATTVLGDSKALSAGSDRARRLGRALLDHCETTRDAVYAHAGPISEAQALRRALEVCGIYRDEAALTAYCFGPLVYHKAGRTFDHVAAHAALGDPVPLSLAQLRGATVAELPVRRALVIENLTPFLDYVEAISAAGHVDELVVFSHGQASWAVVELLRLVRRARVPIAHTGDLDRSGVMILRSLAARTFGPVEPVAMDVATFEQFCHRGRRLAPAERARLVDRVDRDRRDAAVGPCADLLRAILAADTWVEQEALFAGAVIDRIGHGRDQT